MLELKHPEAAHDLYQRARRLSPASIPSLLSGAEPQGAREQVQGITVTVGPSKLEANSTAVQLTAIDAEPATGAPEEECCTPAMEVEDRLVSEETAEEQDPAAVAQDTCDTIDQEEPQEDEVQPKITTQPRKLQQRGRVASTKSDDGWLLTPVPDEEEEVE